MYTYTYIHILSPKLKLMQHQNFNFFTSRMKKIIPINVDFLQESIPYHTK